MESNNNKLIVILMGIIIVILGALCVLFATGTISFNSKDSNSKENETVKEEEKENLPEWVSYILKQDITEISYYEGVASTDASTGNNICSPVKTMTKDQLKKVLLKMSKTSIKKHTIGGMGGPCYEGIKIVYGNKILRIYLGTIVLNDENDKDVIDLLEKENYILDNTNTSETFNWAYTFEWNKEYIETVLK